MSIELDALGEVWLTCKDNGNCLGVQTILPKADDLPSAETVLRAK
jgi:hypothetical protein